MLTAGTPEEPITEEILEAPLEQTIIPAEEVTVTPTQPPGADIQGELANLAETLRRKRLKPGEKSKIDELLGEE